METKELLEDLKFAKKYYNRALKYKKYETFLKNNLELGLCNFFNKNKLYKTAFMFKLGGFYSMSSFSYIAKPLCISSNLSDAKKECILPRYEFLNEAIAELEEMISKEITYTWGITSKVSLNRYKI